jgi:hypothetical protein
VKREKPLGTRELSYPLPADVIAAAGKIQVWVMSPWGKPGPALFGAALLRPS